MKLDDSNAAIYAAEHGLIKSVDGVRTEPLTGGVSCSAFRLWPHVGEPVVIKQALPQLRVEKEWFSDPARAHREALMLQLLHAELGPDHVPKLLFEDRGQAIVVMSSAPLDSENWKVQLLAGHLDMKVAEQVGRLLARMQKIPGDVVPEDLRDKTFFYQLRVDAYVLFIAAQHPEYATELRRLAAELMSATDSLTHADYTPKNLLVSQGRVIILDFEVGHIGHPAFDVASIANHLYLKSVRLPERSADYLKLIEVYLGGYLNELSADLPRDFWPVLGALMLARVLGKSPVEYLDERGKKVVVETGARLLNGTQGLDALK
ncbi:MAG: phosphotransferase family protein [Candidatus Sumerlaeaceae bacterium]